MYTHTYLHHCSTHSLLIPYYLWIATNFLCVQPSPVLAPIPLLPIPSFPVYFSSMVSFLVLTIYCPFVYLFDIKKNPCPRRESLVAGSRWPHTSICGKCSHKPSSRLDQRRNNNCLGFSLKLKNHWRPSRKTLWSNSEITVRELDGWMGPQPREITTVLHVVVVATAISGMQSICSCLPSYSVNRAVHTVHF